MLFSLFKITKSQTTPKRIFLDFVQIEKQLHNDVFECETTGKKLCFEKLKKHVSELISRKNVLELFFDLNEIEKMRF